MKWGGHECFGGRSVALGQGVELVAWCLEGLVDDMSVGLEDALDISIDFIRMMWLYYRLRS